VTSFAERVGLLAEDAEEAAGRQAWDEVRALANAVLALDSSHEAAKKLLGEAEARVSPGRVRQLTVLFCDLVGSTPLADRLDPEGYREVVRSYQAACQDVVERYEGRLKDLLGDGILVDFSSLHTHEDEARRAVKAGLDLLKAMEAVSGAVRERYGRAFEVRVAVHTGLAVIGEMGTVASPEHDALVGEAPNVAAKLQHHARPDTLVIGGPTHELVRGYFAVEPRGSVDVGTSAPVELFEVLNETGAEGRLDVATSLTPFVGRDAEDGRLADLWRSVIDGAHEAVLISGEPGIGKSRLVDLARRRAVDAGAGVLACSCSSYHTTTLLYPVRRLIEQTSGLQGWADPGEALARLRSSLDEAGASELLPVLATLVGIDPRAGFPAPELDGARLREVTSEAVVTWVRAMAAGKPLLFVAEDLHWADPTTIEAVTELLRVQMPGLFVVMTARSAFVSPWSQRRVQLMEPERLSRSELVAMAQGMPESRELDPAELERLADRSDGIPLYLEELIRGAGRPSRRSMQMAPGRQTIPTALVDPLLAQLEAPGVDVRLAQTMATIGHEVDHDVLREVVQIPDEELQVRVETLLAARLLEPGSGDQPTYRFRHWLIGEVAYQTQLTTQRRPTHARVAEVLAARNRPGLPGDDSQVAYHLEHAEHFPAAVDAYVRSARAALVHGANAEASEQLSHALDLLERIDEDVERMACELVVRQARGFAAVSTLGYAAPGAAADYERCLELCRALAPRPEHLPSVIGAWSYYVADGQLDRADEIESVERRRGATAPDSIPDVAGWALTRFFRGDFVTARGEMEELIASYEDLWEVPEEWPLPNDPMSAVEAHLALVLWILGWPVGARAAMGRAKARAERLAFPHGPFTLAYVMSLQAILHRLEGSSGAAAEEAEELLRLSERHGFRFWSMTGNLNAAIGAADRGEPEGLDRLAVALTVWRAAGAALWTPYLLTEQGARLLAADEVNGAIECLDEAAALAERTKACYFLAETLRLRGVSRLRLGDDAGSDDLENAADVARRQGAKAFELRARMSAYDHTADTAARTALEDLLESFDDASGLAELSHARAKLLA
jgi:class 3 adenylate cyclase